VVPNGARLIGTNNMPKNSFNTTLGVASVYSIANSTGSDDAITKSSTFPTTPPGPNGVTLLGGISLADTFAGGLDFQPFQTSPDENLFVFELQNDDANQGMVDALSHAGTYTGQGSFMMLAAGTPLPP